MTDRMNSLDEEGRIHIAVYNFEQAVESPTYVCYTYGIVYPFDEFICSCCSCYTHDTCMASKIYKVVE